MKPLSEFHKARTQCKPCRLAVQTKYQRTAEGKASNRRARLKMLYGITPEEYDALLEKQGSRCAICRSEDPRNPRSPGVWSIDHDHETGKVRGLLCLYCNNHLAWYESHAEAATEYLADPPAGDRAPHERPRRKKRGRPEGPDQ
jgi:Recombination endonuclease VII